MHFFLAQNQSRVKREVRRVSSGKDIPDPGSPDA